MTAPLKSLSPSFVGATEVGYLPPLVTVVPPCDTVPSVDAGPPQSFYGTSSSMDGSGEDFCGLSAEYTWEYVSGPGEVSFSDPSSPTSDVGVTEPGTYVLKLTLNNGRYSVFDYTTIVSLPDNSAVEIACSSSSGSATLCGHSEYTTPSTPPKKYRTQTMSGSAVGCYDNTTLNCSGNVLGFSNSGSVEWTGEYSYSSQDCSVTNTQTSSGDIYANAQPCGNVSSTFSNGPATLSSALTSASMGNVNACPIAILRDPSPAAWGFVSVITQTTVTWTWPGMCVIGGLGSINNTGEIQLILSDEDTEADAIARASKTPGSSCTAETEDRGAGDFTFAFVAVDFDLNFTGLVSGLNYDYSYKLTTEDYGGGGLPVEVVVSGSFTASSDTHQISASIPTPAAGKQTTVSDPTVEIA